MNSKNKEQQNRIAQIFGAKFSDTSRRMETLEFYKSYLENVLHLPLLVTGIEDFSWEEFYLFGPGDKQEYEALKKVQPSSTDIFKMKTISSFIDLNYGLFAKVTRPDKKRFDVPLMDLKTVEKKSEDYLLLHNYSVWCINYQ